MDRERLLFMPIRGLLLQICMGERQKITGQAKTYIFAIACFELITLFVDVTIAVIHAAGRIVQRCLRDAQRVKCRPTRIRLDGGKFVRNVQPAVGGYDQRLVFKQIGISRKALIRFRRIAPIQCAENDRPRHKMHTVIDLRQPRRRYCTYSGFLQKIIVYRVPGGKGRRLVDIFPNIGETGRSAHQLVVFSQTRYVPFKHGRCKFIQRRIQFQSDRIGAAVRGIAPKKL